MRGAILLAALALAGCKSQEVREAERAERAIVMTKGDPRAQCNAVRRARDAWLNAGNQEKYDHWKQVHFGSCEVMGF
jgi:hypothetical protein